MRTGTDWRGIEEWKRDGLELGTQNNEAAKLYDAAISQIVGYYDDPSVGGLEVTLNRMFQLDPSFIGGRAFTLALKFLSSGSTVRQSPDLQATLNDLVKDTQEKGDTVPLRERKHVDAVVHWSEGELYKACLVWEDILIQYPFDIVALALASTTYFYLGKQEEMRDSVARVLPIWEQKNVLLKSYLHGMYAFGLVETKQYRKAEEQALKGLEGNPRDGWSMHALAHVYEMEGRPTEGIQKLTQTCRDWNVCNYLSCHNYWHLALFHIEKGELETASRIFETEIIRRTMISESMFDLVDSTSLPFRMILEDNDRGEKLIGKHWKSLVKLCQPHLRDHILVFNDAHFMMALCGAKKWQMAEEFLESSIRAATISGRKVNENILRAIYAYSTDKYDECVEQLLPIRYQIITIGGSDAQRDVFNQLLIVAGLKSNKPNHRKIVERLINEREGFRGVTPLTNRMLIKLLETKE